MMKSFNEMGLSRWVIKYNLDGTSEIYYYFNYFILATKVKFI